MRRWTPFIIGVAASIGLTVLLWRIGVGGFFLFLLFPLLLWPRGRPSVAHCPTCGYRARAADESYCPRDGGRLTA